MQQLYRLWASTRLGDLQPWSKGWQVDCRYAGLKGRSADDAWMLSSLDPEFAKIKGIPYLGGALDLFKCFDQIIRLLLYAILLIGGFPPRILHAYMMFHERALVHYYINGSIGVGHRHKCGIPQGCPLSMLIVAFLHRAWCNQMIYFGLVPRTLADDILLCASGHTSLYIFQYGFQQTIHHLQEMGGRIASTKSLLFATSSQYRGWLASKVWLGIDSAIGLCISSEI